MSGSVDERRIRVPLFAASFAAKVGWNGEGVPIWESAGRAFARCTP